MPITPAQFAKERGFSERAVRRKARQLGACRILGNRMILEDEDVRAILEALRTAPDQGERGRNEPAGLTQTGHSPFARRSATRGEGRMSEEFKTVQRSDWICLQCGRHNEPDETLCPCFWTRKRSRREQSADVLALQLGRSSLTREETT